MSKEVIVVTKLLASHIDSHRSLSYNLSLVPRSLVSQLAI